MTGAVNAVPNPSELRWKDIATSWSDRDSPRGAGRVPGRKSSRPRLGQAMIGASLKIRRKRQTRFHLERQLIKIHNRRLPNNLHTFELRVVPRVWRIERCLAPRPIKFSGRREWKREISIARRS